MKIEINSNHVKQIRLIGARRLGFFDSPTDSSEILDGISDECLGLGHSICSKSTG